MPENIKTNAASVIVIAAIFAGFIGLVATGIWTLNSPNVTGDLFYMEAWSEGASMPPAAFEPTDTGSIFRKFTPVPDSRLPVTPWIAIPVATALVGAVLGAAASAGGVRIARR